RALGLPVPGEDDAPTAEAAPAEEAPAEAPAAEAPAAEAPAEAPAAEAPAEAPAAEAPAAAEGAAPEARPTGDAESKIPAHRLAPPAGRRVRLAPQPDGAGDDLLRPRPGAAAGTGQLQPDAEPVEGAVVLPRPPGAPHDLAPDGGRRDDPRHGPHRPDDGPLH